LPPRWRPPLFPCPGCAWANAELDIQAINMNATNAAPILLAFIGFS
jgi:hypothetical protein